MCYFGFIFYSPKRFLQTFKINCSCVWFEISRFISSETPNYILTIFVQKKTEALIDKVIRDLENIENNNMTMINDLTYYLYLFDSELIKKQKGKDIFFKIITFGNPDRKFFCIWTVDKF